VLRVRAFLVELRRRHVLRVGIAYAIVAWIVVEVSSTTAPLLQLPGWAPALVLFLALVGFPISLVLAWALELTPAGVRRQSRLDAGAGGALGATAVAAPADGLTTMPPAAPAAAAPAPPHERNSIAVLPFMNMSADAENEYFSDGLSEELLNLLAQVPALRVAARTSAFAFKAKAASIGEIGEQLRVTHVLEGSVRKAGERVRITAQLIEAASGYHLWSQSYDRELRDIFHVQEEIARSIVDVLRVRLGIDRPLSASRPTSTEAHALYLKGRYFAARGTRHELEQAIESFERALELDPTYAPAHAGIAYAYGFLADAHIPAAQVLPSILAAARRALELDDTLADAYMALGMAQSQWSWEWDEADRALRRAIELNPSHAMARFFYAGCWSARGESERALAEVREAHGLDPLSPIISFFVEWFESWFGNADAAIAQHAITEAVAPGFAYIDSPVGDAYRAKGMFDQAIEAYQQAERGLGIPSAGLAIAYAEMGRSSEAERIVAELERRVETGEQVLPELLARAHLALGRTDRALDWLEFGVEHRSAAAPHVIGCADYAPLFEHPRFREIRRRMGFRSTPTPA
jgi:adenylate cyclase